MVLYKCVNCNKEYMNKTDYTRHINIKRKCKKLLQNTPKVAPVLEYNCDDCGKIFTRKYNLVRHKEGRCKMVKEKCRIEMLEEELMEQNEKIEELSELVKELNNKTKVGNKIENNL